MGRIGIAADKIMGELPEVQELWQRPFNHHGVDDAVIIPLKNLARCGERGGARHSW